MEITVASNMWPEIEKFGDWGQLDEIDVRKVHVDFSRSPLSKKNVSAYRCLKDLIRKEKFDLIHCHTPVAGVLTRWIARKSEARMIYTAHGFPSHGWTVR